ncbi:MAG: type IV toxin-antitoxin system AbiEi family antitoxin domain-containing protein [Actinomycetota bacterium]
MRAEERCDLIAARQHGVLTRRQALAAGLSKGSIGARLESGRWRMVQPGVYSARSVPASWHQRLMAAVLSGGEAALASHRSAATLWGLGLEGKVRIEISVTAGRRIKGAIVHRRKPGDQARVARVNGIPTTAMERTLLDIAAVVPAEHAGLALDKALRRGNATLREMRSFLESLGPKGRPGSRVLRELIAARDGRDAQTESELESKLLHLLRRRRVPMPVPQFRVMDGDLVVGRLDFAYPDHRIAIETDGYRWHGGPERWKKDMRRENRLKLLGWTLLHFSWEDVHDRPELVASQVGAALGGQLPGIDSGVAWAYTPSLNDRASTTHVTPAARTSPEVIPSFR